MGESTGKIFALNLCFERLFTQQTHCYLPGEQYLDTIAMEAFRKLQPSVTFGNNGKPLHS